MSRKKEDPVNFGDLIEFKSSIEARLTALETDVSWIKKSLESLKENVDRYKWWILTSFFGSSLLIFILSRLL